MIQDLMQKLQFKNRNRIDVLLNIGLVVLLLYSFLVGVKCLETSIKIVGKDFAYSLFEMASNPFIGLIAGILITSLFQSSSVTTSVIVGLVSTGTLPIQNAIPMILGSNLGTTVTNTLVSLGHINEDKNFKNVFAAATVHDFFNILTVIIILPVEIMTGFLQKSAVFLSGNLYGLFTGFKYTSPIKASLNPMTGFFKSLVLSISENKMIAGFFMLVIAATLIFMSLSLIVKTMKKVMSNHNKKFIDKFVNSNVLSSIILGFILTISVQSSSITTSLLIPMVGTGLLNLETVFFATVGANIGTTVTTGLLNLETVFFATVGANIGTTVTALLASLTGNIAGLSIAIVHLLFNLIGMILWVPNKKMRQVPMKLAIGLSEKIQNKRSFAPVYVSCLFFVFPIIIITFFG